MRNTQNTWSRRGREKRSRSIHLKVEEGHILGIRKTDTVDIGPAPTDIGMTQEVGDLETTEILGPETIETGGMIEGEKTEAQGDRRKMTHQRFSQMLID